RIIACMRNNSPVARDQDVIVTGDDPLWQVLYGRFIARRRNDSAGSERYTNSLEAKIATLGRRSLDATLNAVYVPDQAHFLTRIGL
ncbi:MAG: hypothetical protein ACRDHN_01525, partial [Thermomicrobiales bacterium]